MDTDQWVLYPWFEEHGTSLIHPEDLDRLRHLSPYGIVFKRVGTDGDYVVLSARGQTVRVRPSLIQNVPTPAFDYGQEVRIAGKDLSGRVVEIGWHHQQGRPFYHLAIGGKRNSRRHWDEELAAVG
jgi:hypothetical protein